MISADNCIYTHINITYLCQISHDQLCPLLDYIDPIISYFVPKLGKFPSTDGLFDWPRLAYFSGRQLGLMSVRILVELVSAMTEVTSAASDGHRALQSPEDLLRVLPAEDRGDGAHAVGDHQAAGAACPQFRLGDLWRRRIDPRAHPFDHRPHPEGDQADAGRASDLRRRRRRARSTTWSARYHEVGVRHIVALRGDPATGIGTAYNAHPDGYQDLARPRSPASRSAIPTSRSRSRPIRRSIRRAATSTPTSTR